MTNKRWQKDGSCSACLLVIFFFSMNKSHIQTFSRVTEQPQGQHSDARKLAHAKYFVALYFRHYATSLKVVGSRPDEVKEFFQFT
jgi:hypothetical protein